jgi:predicted ATPase
MYLAKIRVRSDEFPTRGCHPFDIAALKRPVELRFRPVTMLVGENGSGKSTLLEAIARKCGIHIWDGTRRHAAHDNPYEGLLAEYVTATWVNGTVPGSFFRAETFQNLADLLDDVALCDPGRLQYQGGHILNVLSHGEGILSYLGGRLRIRGLYFLDEPEAALSPASQIRFLRLLQRLEAGGQAQFVIATHSPILLAYPGARLYSFDSGGIAEVTYEETAHYRLYRQFLTDRSALLLQA